LGTKDEFKFLSSFEYEEPFKTDDGSMDGEGDAKGEIFNNARTGLIIHGFIGK
jgi:hypothetical protein